LKILWRFGDDVSPLNYSIYPAERTIRCESAGPDSRPERASFMSRTDQMSESSDDDGLQFSAPRLGVPAILTAKRGGARFA